MGLRPLDYVGWLAALLVVASVFLPWMKPAEKAVFGAKERAALVRRLGERGWVSCYVLITPEDLQWAAYGDGSGATGFAIPFLSSSDDAKRREQGRALWHSNVLGHGREDDRVYFIFLAPAFALFAAMFVSWARQRWALVLPLAACLGWYGIVRFKLNETYLDRFVAGPHAGLGLWLALYGLLILSLLLFVRLLAPRSRW